MKVAKLPNGKTLKFPDETADEHIDATVKEAMKDHIAHSQKQDQKEQSSMQLAAQRHTELMQGLQVVAHLLATLIDHLNQGHASLTGILQEHSKALSKPRKIKAIRDEKGKIIGSEEI